MKMYKRYKYAAHLTLWPQQYNSQYYHLPTISIWTSNSTDEISPNKQIFIEQRWQNKIWMMNEIPASVSRISLINSIVQIIICLTSKEHSY